MCMSMMHQPLMAAHNVPAAPRCLFIAPRCLPVASPWDRVRRSEEFAPSTLPQSVGPVQKDGIVHIYAHVRVCHVCICLPCGICVHVQTGTASCKYARVHMHMHIPVQRDGIMHTAAEALVTRHALTGPGARRRGVVKRRQPRHVLEAATP